MNELSKIVDEYYTWLRAKTHVINDELTQWTAISTPFNGIFNDRIEVYCKKENGKWILTDGGETLNLLEEVGVQINRSTKRKSIVDSIIKNYGIGERSGEFFTEANKDNFSQKKHNLVQALLELHELEYLSEKTVRSLFKEDVERHLNEKRIIHTRDIKFAGYNGLDYHFDFHFPKFNSEIVLKASDQLNKSTVSSFVYSWQNVKKLREEHNKKESQAAILINDVNNKPKPDLIEALSIEGVKTFNWSNKSAFEKYISQN